MHSEKAQFSMATTVGLVTLRMANPACPQARGLTGGTCGATAIRSPCISFARGPRDGAQAVVRPSRTVMHGRDGEDGRKSCCFSRREMREATTALDKSAPCQAGLTARGAGGGGVGTRPWWLALLACGGAYRPLALEPSAMTSRHPYYCGHPHCCGHPPAWVGIQNATSAHGVLP